MKYVKHALMLFLAISLVSSCEEEETSYALQEISAPTNVSATFDIAQDDSGVVSLTPVADGATSFQVYFGDVENETPTEVSPGGTTTHTYVEGDYLLRVVAVGLTGLTSELNRSISISFTPPSELNFDVVVSSTNTYEVVVTPSAVNATMYEVYFGDVENEEPTIVLDGATATHVYAQSGEYTIRVVAKSASVNTIEATQAVTITDPILIAPEDFVGSWVMANEAGSLGVGPAPGDISWFAIDEAGLTTRACYFDDTYVFGQDGSFTNVLGAETWIEEWQGGSNACGAPVAPHDGTVNATYTVDGTAGTLTINGTGAYIGLPKAVNAGELPNVDVPESITYTVSLSEDKNTMNVVVESGTGVYWQYKLTRSEAVTSPIVGTWVMANEAGSLGVGPAPGDISWFAIDDQGLVDRACYFDDTYVFGEDGSFMNVLGAETWLEGWQSGTDDACGTPIAPHNGSAAATYAYDSGAGTITITGAGAYIGLPKANNQGELPNVEVPSSIIYNVTLSDNNNTMNVLIESGTGSGVYWQYKLVKQESTPPPAVAGTWRMANEAGSLGVGPAPGDISWFAIDDQGLVDRACYFDDTYVFGNDGSFSNVLGADTWLEGWQSGTDDACGTPIAPHDGSASATYVYDAGAGTITINGAGAYIGLPKANNQGELPNVALPDSIVYNVTLSENDTVMNITIESGTGSGVYWQYKLVKD